jgi:hypothetical protein
MIPSPPWHEWNPCVSSLRWLPRKASVFIKWMSSQHFLMVI